MPMFASLIRPVCQPVGRAINISDPTPVDSLRFIAIIYSGNTWNFIDTSDQGLIDAVDAVELPEPKSLGFFLRKPNCRTLSLV